MLSLPSQLIGSLLCIFQYNSIINYILYVLLQYRFDLIQFSFCHL